MMMIIIKSFDYRTKPTHCNFFLNLYHCIQGGQKVIQVQITISMQPFEIILNGFHQNVPGVSGNKD